MALFCQSKQYATMSCIYTLLGDEIMTEFGSCYVAELQRKLNNVVVVNVWTSNLTVVGVDIVYSHTRLTEEAEAP